MDYINLIQTIGFPIACVIGMAWYLKYLTDQHRDDRNAADNRHREEIAEITKALNNNTTAITKLTDYIMFGDSENDKRH